MKQPYRTGLAYPPRLPGAAFLGAAPALSAQAQQEAADAVDLIEHSVRRCSLSALGRRRAKDRFKGRWRGRNSCCWSCSQESGDAEGGCCCTELLHVISPIIGLKAVKPIIFCRRPPQQRRKYPSRVAYSRGVDEQSKQGIRVLVVEDQALMSQALAMFVDAGEGMHCVGIAEDGAAAVQMTADLRPDVVLMDMQLPVMDGVEATRRIVAAAHVPSIVAVTTFVTEEYLLPAFRAGVQGFIVKDSRPHEVAAAVTQAFEGSMPVSPQVSRALVRVAMTQPDRPAGTKVLLEPVTPREREVLACLGQGLSNQEIAAELFVTEATVKAHVGRLMTKFGVDNRVKLVVNGVRLGLVTL